MKRNYWLGGLLIALISLAYWTEERGERVRREEVRQRTQVVDFHKLGMLQQLKGNGFLLTRGKDKYTAGKFNVPVDPQNMQRFLDYLGGIRVVRKLTSEEIANRNNFFGPRAPGITAKFEKGEVQFVLGEPVDFSQSFYMEVIEGDVSTTVVAKDISPMNETYSRGEEHRSKERYRRLLTLFLINESFFYNNKIVKYDKIISALVSPLKNRDFALNFEELEMNPAPIGGLKVNKKKLLGFKRFLTNLKAKEVYPRYDKKNFNQEVAAIILNNSERKLEELKLYRGNGSLDGYFITKQGDPFLYEVSYPDAKKLFSHYQDFWFKRPAGLEGFKKFSIKFDDRPLDQLTVQNAARFSVHALKKGVSPSHKNFRKFFSYFGREAARVTKMGESFNETIKLSIGGRELRIKEKNDEIILADPEEGIQFHYLKDPIQKISLKSSEYFL